MATAAVLVFVVFLIGIAVSIPIGISMILGSIAPMFLVDKGGNITQLLNNTFSGANSVPILAVPLFILGGVIMAEGGISKKLFNFFAYFAGRIPGGIPCAVILTCLFYGAISGSGPATAAAVGAMCIPILVELGYDKVFSAAIVATAGGLGVIIPPSIPFIMYALFTQESVGDMFTAGIIPGCLIAATIMFYCWFYCKRHGEDKAKIAENYARLKKRGFIRVFIDGFWAVLTPVIILGGIYGGFVTPTEAACVSVFYALIVCIFIYRTISIKDVPQLLKDAIASYAPICVLIGLATGFSRILVLLRAADVIQAVLTSVIHNGTMLLIFLNILLLILGMFMDVGAAVVILAPILLPIAKGFGIDGIHLGIVMVTNLAVGFVTPPFGMNLFVAAPLGDTNVATLGKKALPFIGCFIIALLMITFIPPISLFLL